MYLGIDLGTSELKALLLDEGRQRVVGSAAEPLAVSRPQPLCSEQQPEHWWSALGRALKRLRVETPGEMQVRHARFRALYPAVAGGRHEEASP